MNERLLTQWRAFASGASVDTSVVRPITLAAWMRCRELGITPERLKYRFLSDVELVAKRRDNAAMIAAAAPYLDHLSMTLSDRAHAIALADRDGWILELREHPKGAFGGRSTGLCLGASWSESAIGNNGVGTALATGSPVLVYGIEHYAAQYHAAHCLGVPIRCEGTIVGCLDVSVTREEDANPAHLAIAQACVASIELTLDALRATERDRVDTERFVAIGKLLATTVHDLKGPLTVIKGIAQLGDMTSVSAEEQEYFRRIVSHANQLQAMIEDLQAMPRDPVDLVPGSPTEILREIAEEYQPVCSTRGIMLEHALSVEAEVPVAAPLLKRALANIVDNAVKVTPPGGRLHLSVVTRPTDVMLRISDTGPGIPEGIRERVFEPFVHGGGGTGLGLFMARQAVEQHGGSLTFDTSSAGTTFVVLIPKQSTDAAVGG